MDQIRLPTMRRLIATAALLLDSVAWTAVHGESDYRLGKEDIVHIQVWNRPELSGDFPVNADGDLVVPLLDPVKASDRSPTELGDELKKRYSLLDPTVFKVVVDVVEYNSRSVTVVGQVLKPERYGFRTIPDVWEVLREAGGPTATADLSRVQIVRRGEGGGPISVFVDLTSLLEGTLTDSLPTLRAGDTVIVNGIATGAVATGATIQVLGFVGTPGVYSLRAARTVPEALAVSGGPLPDANLSKVQLTRTTPTGVVAYRLDLEGLLYEGKAGTEFELKEGDTLTIPGKAFGAGTLLNMLLIFVPLITSITSLIIVLDNP